MAYDFLKAAFCFLGLKPLIYAKHWFNIWRLDKFSVTIFENWNETKLKRIWFENSFKADNLLTDDWWLLSRIYLRLPYVRLLLNFHKENVEIFATCSGIWLCRRVWFFDVSLLIVSKHEHIYWKLTLMVTDKEKNSRLQNPEFGEVTRFAYVFPCEN